MTSIYSLAFYCCNFDDLSIVLCCIFVWCCLTIGLFVLWRFWPLHFCTITFVYVFYVVSLLQFLTDDVYLLFYTVIHFYFCLMMFSLSFYDVLAIVFCLMTSIYCVMTFRYCNFVWWHISIVLWRFTKEFSLMMFFYRSMTFWMLQISSGDACLSFYITF